MPLSSSRQNWSFRKGCRERSEYRVRSPPQTLPSTRANLRIQSYPSIRQLPQKRDRGETEAARGGGDTNSSEETALTQPRAVPITRKSSRRMSEETDNPQRGEKRNISHQGVQRPTARHDQQQTAEHQHSTSVAQPFVATRRTKEIIMEKSRRSAP